MTYGEKLVEERKEWLESAEGKDCINTLMSIAGLPTLSRTAKDLITIEVIKAYKAGGRAAVKVFTLESNN